jgi:hypothetical protein
VRRAGGFLFVASDTLVARRPDATGIPSCRVRHACGAPAGRDGANAHGGLPAKAGIAQGAAVPTRTAAGSTLAESPCASKNCRGRSGVSRCRSVNPPRKAGHATAPDRGQPPRLTPLHRWTFYYVAGTWAVSHAPTRRCQRCLVKRPRPSAWGAVPQDSIQPAKPISDVMIVPASRGKRRIARNADHPPAEVVGMVDA